MTVQKIDFNKSNGLIPAVVQDNVTGKILMVGFMNEEAYNKTLSEKVVTFYSRTKERLWTKGETSGNVLHVVDLLIDCDNDTVLIKAKPAGPTCHTGADTCFNESNTGKGAFLNHLQNVISERKNEGDDSKSYTASLFKKGVNKIAQKVGEEAVELVIEAKDDNKDLFLGEAADLLFHFLVLLEQKEIKLDEVISILETRHSK